MFFPDGLSCPYMVTKIIMKKEVLLQNQALLKMMILSLVSMTGLEKCGITSAYLLWLFHSGELVVAHGPLVTTSYHVRAWSQ